MDGIHLEDRNNRFVINEFQREYQRLLFNQENDEFFKSNGDMLNNDDFFQFNQSKLVITSFEPDPSLATYKRSAGLCERKNQNKYIPYQLNLYIGKLIFLNHPLFILEDTYAVELKELLRAYRLKVD